jgi:two-component system, chemotaxis family, sensor kinase CheA
MKFDELFRILHTIKGNSPFYNLKKVAAAAHNMETIISEIIKLKNYEEEKKDELNDLLDGLIAGLNYHLNSISDFLSVNDIFRTGEKLFEIPESKINALIKFINEKLPEDERQMIIDKVRELKKYSIKFVLKRYVSNAYQLAERLSKKINPIKIVNEDLQIDYIYFKEFFDVYIHIVRNAVDHAIEMPEERVNSGKTEEGNISIELREIYDNKQKILEIKTVDDGKGIDVEKIKNKILQQGILTSEEISNLGRNEIVDYIFHSGISAKDSITDVSGRGVGMCAVKNVVEKYKGDITINTELGKGTEIIIRLKS